jgi:opacity protein-like surface antigen
MSVRKLILASSLAVVAVVTVPGRASADWYVTPFIGGNFGGNANFGNFNTFDDEFDRRVDLGASLGWMGNGIAGFELDFGWSPNFFQNTSANPNFQWGDSNVTSLMGNVVIGAPIGGQRGPGVRPYGTAGIGLLRSSITGSTFFNDLSANDLGFNVGAGLHGYFTDNVGLRGDVRYFRSLQDNEPDGSLDLGLADFNFWRASIGVTFRFGNGN